MAFGIDDAIGAGIPLVGGLLGKIFSNPDRGKAEEELKKILAGYEGIKPPSISDQTLNLDQYQSAGQYDPRMEGLEQQGESSLSSYVADPRAKGAELDALTALTDVGQQGGLRLSDKAALNDVITQTNRNAQGKRGAIMAKAAARGTGGSGFDLAAQLAAGQDDAQTAADQGLKVAGMAEDRALQALMGAGDLGGRIRSEGFNEAKGVASAEDAINRFNTANRQDVLSRNTAATNAGSMYNLGNAQDISNRNTGVKNSQQVHNKGLYQTDFENRMKRQDGVQVAGNNLAKHYTGQALNTQQTFGGMASEAQKSWKGYANEAADDEKKKKAVF